jgi:hypothetical protein
MFCLLEQWPGEIGVKPPRGMVTVTFLIRESQGEFQVIKMKKLLCSKLA